MALRQPLPVADSSCLKLHNDLKLADGFKGVRSQVHHSSLFQTHHASLILGRVNFARLTSNLGGSRKESTDSMIWWDLQSVPPPNHQFIESQLLSAHRAMRTGLFSLSPPVKVRAHGTEPLAEAVYDHIIKPSKLDLQQSISSGSEQRSTRSWKAMVVNMLLWATDHSPGTADVIIISKVFDRSMADVIHQLHPQNCNIMVATSFPPRDMTLLRHCAPPLGCKPLRQIFPHIDSMPNTADVSTNTHTSDPEAVNLNENRAEVATGLQPQAGGLSHGISTSLCSQISQNCKNIIEEFLQNGITKFRESDLYEFSRVRHGENLDYKEAGFEKLDAFLEVVVPGVNFTTMLVEGRTWILCSCSGLETTGIPHDLQEYSNQTSAISDIIEEMRVRQSILLSDIARPKVSVPVLYCGPLTIEEVRTWLQELVACGRADTGINLSLLGKDFEEHKGKKLNYRSLHCPTLMVLLSKFESLVRLEHKDSMVILFPSNMKRRNHDSRSHIKPGIVPVNQPLTWRRRPVFSSPMNCYPPAYHTSLPRIIQVPGQISIRKNVPVTTELVPIFPVASNPTLRIPAAELVDTVIRANMSAPSVSEMKINGPGEQAGEEKIHLPYGKSHSECQSEFLLPKVATPANKLAAEEPVSLQSSMGFEATIPPRVNPFKLANTDPPAHSGIRFDPAGRKLHLPDGDTGVPTQIGNAKVIQYPGDKEAKQKTNADAGSGENFYIYSSKVVREREAIKRTFESVNKRLQEEFKNRRLAERPVSDASNQANNSAK